MEQVLNYLEASGNYTTALTIQRQIHAHHLYAQGPEHPDALAAWQRLAHYTGEAGDAAAAREEFTAPFPIRERVLGIEHPDTLTTRSSLARWAGEAGDAAAAREEFTAPFPIRERVLGTEHPDTLTTRSSLARWAGEAGDAAAARDQYAALLPIRERVLGTEHPNPEHPEQPRLLDERSRRSGVGGWLISSFNDRFLKILKTALQSPETPSKTRSTTSVVQQPQSTVC
ncbi:tetratricopeptide repeat protein [Nonomuraea sp. NPDC003709]|uniref:tetratricopeptide repeat protein n=1 Tax=Nonomuraea sp. NPDC003709 TaxID=3154450 RepID=UPI0033BA9601